jgi:malonyl-CoA O-methyltransferase
VSFSYSQLAIVLSLPAKWYAFLQNRYTEHMSIENAYNEWSGTYDGDENLTRDLDQEVTRALLSGEQFGSILELGCGTGKNTAYLEQIGRAVHALDFSKGMIEKAVQKVKTGNVRFSITDLTKRWPCEDQAYDLIVCNLVLEHIEDLTHIFSEAARTLMPTGQLLINELHPFKQYQGTSARYRKGTERIEVTGFVHHISDFISAGRAQRLQLEKLGEYWHAQDRQKLPRLVSFLFAKG